MMNRKQLSWWNIQFNTAILHTADSQQRFMYQSQTGNPGLPLLNIFSGQQKAFKFQEFSGTIYNFWFQKFFLPN